MPITPGSQSNRPAAPTPNEYIDEANNNLYGFPGMNRSLFVTDKDGIEVKINTQADLQRILDQMTPEEKERWRAQYRFSPVVNDTGIPDYSGVFKDL